MISRRQIEFAVKFVTPQLLSGSCKDFNGWHDLVRDLAAGAQRWLTTKKAKKLAVEAAVRAERERIKIRLHHISQVYSKAASKATKDRDRHGHRLVSDVVESLACELEE